MNEGSSLIGETRSCLLRRYESLLPQLGEPVDTSKQRAEAARKEKVHKEEAALVLDERDFHFGAGDGGAPGIFADFVPGEGSQFGAAEQTD